MSDNDYYEDDEDVDLDLESEKAKRKEKVLSEHHAEMLDEVTSPTNPRLNRRSTLGTAETKSLMKKGNSRRW